MKLSLTAGQLGFIRAMGVVAVVSILSYLGDAAHWSGIVSTSTGILLAGLSLAIEHMIEAKTGSALFGAAVQK